MYGIILTEVSLQILNMQYCSSCAKKTACASARAGGIHFSKSPDFLWGRRQRGDACFGCCFAPRERTCFGRCFRFGQRFAPGGGLAAGDGFGAGFGIAAGRGLAAGEGFGSGTRGRGRTRPARSR